MVSRNRCRSVEVRSASLITTPGFVAVPSDRSFRIGVATVPFNAIDVTTPLQIRSGTTDALATGSGRCVALTAVSRKQPVCGIGYAEGKDIAGIGKPLHSGKLALVMPSPAIPTHE